MDFEDKLIRADVISCYQKLILDVVLEDGSLTQALCVDDNKNENLYTPGTVVWLSPVTNKNLKIKYEACLIEQNGDLCLTRRANAKRVFGEAFEKGKIAELADYTEIRKLDKNEKNASMDFELSNEKHQKAYVCVACFFDTQMDELVFPTLIDFLQIKKFEHMRNLRKQGFKTYFFIVASKSGLRHATFSWIKNPEAASIFYDEAQDGLNFLCYSCNVTQNNVTLSKRLKINF